MIVVTLYTRKNCSLCDQTQTHLAALQETIPHRLNMVDVDDDPKLAARYGVSLPVVVVGPYTLKAPIEPKDLAITLQAVQLGQQQNAQIDADLAEGRLDLGLTWTRADRFSLWMGKHYLAFVTALVAVYLFGAFLPALLAKAGLATPANVFYKAYSYVCHQLPYRSWFLFGEQTAYPRALAGVTGLLTFEQATGISESTEPDAVWTARVYIGDERIGYKVALCQRDVAIYAAIIFFGLVFAAWRRFWPGRPIRPLHWMLWILIGIVPIGLDGGSQLVSQYMPVLTNYLPVRESTPFLRSLTGFLFGFSTAWFGIPYMEESFGETLRIYSRKKMLYDQQLRKGAKESES
ncbi:MAG: DUF2085 domain-containing protein [Chloroflexota bacterium]